MEIHWSKCVRIPNVDTYCSAKSSTAMLFYAKNLEVMDTVPLASSSPDGSKFSPLQGEYFSEMAEPTGNDSANWGILNRFEEAVSFWKEVLHQGLKQTSSLLQRGFILQGPCVYFWIWGSIPFLCEFFSEFTDGHLHAGLFWLFQTHRFLDLNKLMMVLKGWPHESMGLQVTSIKSEISIKDNNKKTLIDFKLLCMKKKLEIVQFMEVLA